MLGLAQVFGQQLTSAGQGQLATPVFQGRAGLAQGFQVATTGTETALSRLLVAHAGFQVLAQQLQAIGGFGRQADGHMAVVADFQANVLLAEVGFVANQGDLAGVWALFQKFRPQGKGSAASGAVASTTSNTRSASLMACKARATPIFST